MFKHIDMDAAMRRLADRKIEAAMQEGKFDKLEGAGQPLDLEPMPADENARMLWWALRLFKRNDVIPDEVRYRKAIDALASTFPHARDEPTLRAEVGRANALVRKLNTMGTNVIPTQLVAFDVEREVDRWRAARAGA